MVIYAGDFMQKWSEKISEMLKFRGNLHQHLSSALTYAEEREEEYEKARRRIFNVEKGNGGGGGSSGSSGGEKQLQIHSDRQLHSLSSTKVYLSSLSAPWYIIYYIFTKYYLSSEKLRPTELELRVQTRREALTSVNPTLVRQTGLQLAKVSALVDTQHHRCAV